MAIVGRLRSPRLKSFKSEESAKKWAEARGIQKYNLKDLRRPGAKDKKIVVIEG